MHELFSAAIADRQASGVRRVFETGQPLYSEENESQTAEGHRWYNTSLTPLKNERGEVEYVIGIARDVTDRKRAEAALRQSEALYRAVVDSQTELVCRFAPDCRITFVNETVCRSTGLGREELVGASFLPYIPEPDRSDLAARLAALSPQCPVLEDEHAALTLTGEPRRYHWVNRGVFDEQGRLVEIQAVGRDVTEQRRAEEALRESEARYRAVVESQTELICRFVPDSILTFVNDAYCRFFGKDREELIGRSFLPLIPEEDRVEAVRHFAPVSAARPVVDHEHQVVTPSGEVRWMRWINRGIFDEQGRLVEFQATGSDVTERKRAEESRRQSVLALRQSEENYRLLFESNLNGIAIVMDGRIVRANKAYCDIHRIPPETVTGRSILDLVHPDHRQGILRNQEAMARGEAAMCDGNFRIVRGDGTTGWVEVRTGSMTWEGKPARLAIVADITERVRLEEDLREAQKMEAVGQLAGGIAHDFNNLLTGILCNTQLIRTTPGIPKDVYETSDVIEKAACRAAELTSQLLGFARRGMHKDVHIDLRATIQSVLQLMGGAIGPHITVEAALASEPAWTHGDPAQMEQVVLNLAMNARDSMPAGGLLTFAAETVELGAAACVGRPGAKPGRYVVLRVSDTGCGINEEIHDRIFEPFFTTKPVGKGTGMGLATVYGIARSHGGWVEVDSVVGKGSTFRVYLPALIGPLTQPPAGEGGGEGEKGGRVRGAAPAKRRAPASAPRVMVVDDDEMVRKAMTRALAGGGYSVVTAASGREAVDTYGTFGSGIDVVIIDMAMPDMDGLECFQALRRQDPHVRAILCTGGPADEGVRDAVGKGLVDFIPKPYRLEQLAAAIEKALATRGDGPPEAPLAPRP
jgi:PAS domain S-box-containing protein